MVSGYTGGGTHWWREQMVAKMYFQDCVLSSGPYGNASCLPTTTACSVKGWGCCLFFIHLGSGPNGCLVISLKISVTPVQFSRSVMSNSLRPSGLQHFRPPCPSPNPGVYSNSWPLSQWCHPTISSSVIPFSFCLQSFPASGSFPTNQFFTPGDQSIGVSASASVLPMNIQDWSPLGWTGWISLQSKGLSRVFNTKGSKVNSLALSFPYSPTLKSIHDYWKNHGFE